VEWKRVVDLAAEEWSGVAQHLGILRIPDFMDRFRGRETIVFVEGKLDAAYLTKAIRLFRGEKALSQIEIHQIGDEASSGGVGGGKDALNRAYQFLAAKQHLIKRKILLLYILM
jgi:hypothetical protein